MLFSKQKNTIRKTIETREHLQGTTVHFKETRKHFHETNRRTFHETR